MTRGFGSWVGLVCGVFNGKLLGIDEVFNECLGVRYYWGREVKELDGEKVFSFYQVLLIMEII